MRPALCSLIKWAKKYIIICIRFLLFFAFAISKTIYQMYRFLQFVFLLLSCSFDRSFVPSVRCCCSVINTTATSCQHDLCTLINFCFNRKHSYDYAKSAANQRRMDRSVRCWTLPTLAAYFQFLPPFRMCSAHFNGIYLAFGRTG